MPAVKRNFNQYLSQPYADRRVWGTGINPIHQFYGSDQLRVPGRQNEGPVRQKPASAIPGFVETAPPWGYSHEDVVAGYTNTYLFYDGRPPIGTDSPQWRGQDVSQPPVDATGAIKNFFRGLWGGAHRTTEKTANQIPVETVSEGWLNKPKGTPADSKPADQSQVFIQTSQVQRYKTRNNQAAQMRDTDDARSDIQSRVVGQKLKVYSGQERHYDMFPYQQRDILRPFWFRRAGTGPQYWLAPNEMYLSEPIQRTPPPDPYLGPPETAIEAPDYGYTSEDQSYA
jgi:hypothetical protein